MGRDANAVSENIAWPAAAGKWSDMHPNSKGAKRRERRQTAGLTILGLFFGGIYGMVAWTEGILTASLMFAAVLVCLALLLCAINLLTGE